VVGKAVYLQLSEKAWRQAVPEQDVAAAVALFHGRWMKVPATDAQFSDFSDFGDKAGMVDSVF
jgi:hypothetical protein